MQHSECKGADLPFLLLSARPDPKDVKLQIKTSVSA